jgi:hypothetical protein
MDFIYYTYTQLMLIEERSKQYDRKRWALVKKLDEAIEVFGTLARMH